MCYTGYRYIHERVLERQNKKKNCRSKMGNFLEEFM